MVKEQQKADRAIFLIKCEKPHELKDSDIEIDSDEDEDQDEPMPYIRLS